MPVQTVRYVEQEEVRKIPVQTVRYVEEEQVRNVPVQTVRYVEQQQVRKVPTTVCRVVEEEVVRKVPVTTSRIVYEERVELVPLESVVSRLPAQQPTLAPPRSTFEQPASSPAESKPHVGPPTPRPALDSEENTPEARNSQKPTSGREQGCRRFLCEAGAGRESARDSAHVRAESVPVLPRKHGLDSVPVRWGRDRFRLGWSCRPGESFGRSFGSRQSRPGANCATPI